MRENAEMIANLDPFGPPLIADMDTGYGGELTRASFMSVSEALNFIGKARILYIHPFLFSLTPLFSRTHHGSPYS